MEKANENELIIQEDFFDHNKIEDLIELLERQKQLEKIPELIEYKAPPIFEESRIIYNPKERPNPKGKLPRKKQNGYF